MSRIEQANDGEQGRRARVQYEIAARAQRAAQARLYALPVSAQHHRWERIAAHAITMVGSYSRLSDSVDRAEMAQAHGVSEKTVSRAMKWAAEAGVFEWAKVGDRWKVTLTDPETGTGHSAPGSVPSTESETTRSTGHFVPTTVPSHGTLPRQELSRSEKTSEKKGSPPTPAIGAKDREWTRAMLQEAWKAQGRVRRDDVNGALTLLASGWTRDQVKQVLTANAVTADGMGALRWRLKRAAHDRQTYQAAMRNERLYRAVTGRPLDRPIGWRRSGSTTPGTAEQHGPTRRLDDWGAESFDDDTWEEAGGF